MPEGVPEALEQPPIQVRVWGVRGSIPTPCAGNLRFGGNTSCIEAIFSSGQRMIFDAGTGIRNLGLELLRTRSSDRDFHVFLSHFHWDHVQGLPFFPPLYNPAATITFYSSRTPEHLQDILYGQMVTPYFPVRFDDLAASVRFVQVCDAPLTLGEVEVSSFALNHPQGASGYRVVHRGKTLVYATDHEHGVAQADNRILKAARNADVLFYDAQFTPEEYEGHRGWGHGTWLEAAHVGARAEVKQLVLFHHDPGHDDTTMQQIVEKARCEFPRTIAATEGETITIR